jgi:maleate cis-trans isomerase
VDVLGVKTKFALRETPICRRNGSFETLQVFMGGNGFRAVAAIEPLKASIRRPVVTSNQVLLWNLLARVGASFKINGFGQLFAHQP